MDALSRVSAQVLDSALPSLPLYLLQATAVIGMIGVLLIATRRAGHAIEGRRLYVGVTLGLIYLFNSWFVAGYTQGVVKLHLGFDILLVSGLLGGWRGGLACLAAAVLARYQFVGTQFFLPASLEAALQMITGVWLRRRLHPRMLNELSLRMILRAWSARIAATAVGLALGVAIIGADQLPVAELAIQRVLALPVSLLMLGRCSRWSTTTPRSTRSASASRPGCASTRSVACPTCARWANGRISGAATTASARPAWSWSRWATCAICACVTAHCRTTGYGIAIRRRTSIGCCHRFTPMPWRSISSVTRRWPCWCAACRCRAAQPGPCHRVGLQSH